MSLIRTATLLNSPWKGYGGTRGTTGGGGGGALWDLEPAGFTSIFDSDLTALPSADGWTPQGADISVITDGTAPLSPTHKVVQWLYRTSLPAGQSPGKMYNDNHLSNQLDYFVGYYFKFSSDFVNNEVGTKMWYPLGNPNNFFTLFKNGAGIIFGVQPGVVGGGTYNLAPNISDPAITLGSWHKMQLHWKASTNETSRNMIFKWSIDGTLAGNFSAAADYVHPYVSGEDDITKVGNWPSGLGVAEWSYDPTYGGTGSSPSQNCTQCVDHIYVSTP